MLAGKTDPAGYELRFRRRDERRFDALVLISPFDPPGITAGFLASVYDITERKNAERTAQFLAEAGEILNRSLDYEETLRAITSMVVPRFADWCFVDLVEADGGFRRIAVAHPGGPGTTRSRRVASQLCAEKCEVWRLRHIRARRDVDDE